MRQIIGIVGFGVTGKSFLRFVQSVHFLEAVEKAKDYSLDSRNYEVVVWDKRKLDSLEEALVEQYGAEVFTGTLEELFEKSTFVCLSPGIDASQFFPNYRQKVLTELDLFGAAYPDKIVGITGTVGKTTVTQLAGLLLARTMHHEWVAVMGNIGTAMLDCVTDSRMPTVAVIELSSFQLEHVISFAPQTAVWTNFYPNHLDRHKTIEEYFAAKAEIVRHQESGSNAVLGLDLLDDAYRHLTEKLVQETSATVTFIAHRLLTEAEQAFVDKHGCNVFGIYNDHIAWYRGDFWEPLLALSVIPAEGFLKNWLIVLATAAVNKVNVSELTRSVLEDLWQTMRAQIGEHRLERVGTVRGVDFYNDSKATIIQSVQAALEYLDTLHRPIILILGGYAKGADRSSLKPFLVGIKNIKVVLCLGAAASDYGDFTQYESLEALIPGLKEVAQEGDVVLFSPGGASFDLFADYKERGKMFKELVKALE